MDHRGSEKRHVPVLSWWELWPMFAWGGYTVYLYATGRIFLLLRPLFAHVALGGACALLAAAVWGWVVRFRRLRAEFRRLAEAREAGRLEELRPVCVCGVSEGGWGRYVRSLAFAVPLVVGLALPPRGVGALAAVQWGAGDLSMLADLAARRQVERTEMRGAYGWTTLLGVAQRLARGTEAKVGALGFVARKKGDPPGRFYLVRFVMTCCAADARPVAVPARLDAEALRRAGRDPDALLEALEADQWVEAYGRVDPREKVFWIEDLDLVRPPKNPYL